MVPRQNPNRRKQEGGPISSPPNYEVEEIWKKKQEKPWGYQIPTPSGLIFAFV